jgi:hypothetical protein
MRWLNLTKQEIDKGIADVVAELAHSSSKSLNASRVDSK